jgi:hypothetical protein
MDVGMHQVLGAVTERIGTSMLRQWQLGRQPIKINGKLDLACEPRSFPFFIGHFQKLSFHGRGGGQTISPWLPYVNVTGRAGAIAATVTVNSLHPIVDGRLHERLIGVGLNFHRIARVRDEGNLDLGHSAFFRLTSV